jgi:hypothetical protein
MRRPLRQSFGLFLILIAPWSCKHRPTAARTLDAGSPAESGALVEPGSDCAHLEKDLQFYTDLAAQSASVSAFLAALKLPRGTPVGAVESDSLQGSSGRGDPRILIERGCLMLTFTLVRPGVEVALLHQRPTFTLPDRRAIPPDERARLPEGVVLADLKIGPTGPASGLVVNYFKPQGDYPDALKCSNCHVVPTDGPSPVGLLPLALGTQNVMAVVLPYGLDDSMQSSDPVYAVPKDLADIAACYCGDAGVPRSGVCSAYTVPASLSAESCRRLTVLLASSPAQLPKFAPP